MLQTKILSNIEIKQAWLDELLELFPELDITIANTTASLRPKWNPWHNSIWGDFDWIRGMIGDADIRCFVTTFERLNSIGITSHYGMYDMVDRDLNYDFYMGLPKKFDNRAIKNGFKSNFVWIFVHEACHGMEKQSSGPDRTHMMEDQGRLLELLNEHRKRYNLLIEKITLLKRLIQLYEQLKAITLSSNKK